MRWLPAALLGGVMMTSGVLGHASDMFHQTLPLRGTAEASMARVSTILTTLGADPPGKYMERYIQQYFGQNLSCYVGNDAIVTKRLIIRARFFQTMPVG